MKKVWQSPYLPWLLISLGIFLRLKSFWAVRSLWLDEASLALDVLQKNMSQLIGTGINAPDGFLAPVKLFTLAGGGHELVLRSIRFWAEQ